MTTCHVRMIVVASALAAVSLAITGCGGSEQSGPATSASTAAGTASTGRTYRDAAGDVPAGTPDLTSVSISNDASTVRVRFRFANAPPLSTSPSGEWTDMLLMGIDVPPIGPGPTPSGWTGLDYALGMHGVDDRAVFRSMQPGLGADGGTGMAPGLRTLRSRTQGREVTIALPVALLGNPKYFDFTVAVGREGGDEASSAGGDMIPARGTARYRLQTATG